jgi:hypothetical protein
MTRGVSPWRALAGGVGLFLLWQSAGFAASFASGQHAGAGPYIVPLGALAGALLALGWGAIRRRVPSGWIVLLGGIAGSWLPMLGSSAYATLDPVNPISFNHAMTFWLVWGMGAVLGVSAPVGLWLLWLAVRPLLISAKRVA